MASSNEVELSRRCWNKFKRDSIPALFSPFFVCLASGNLRRDAFCHYISQDVHFCKAFAQALELAEDCADDYGDDDDDVKITISEFKERILEEVKTFDSFVQEWGTDLIKKSPLNSAIVQYTEFLLAIASGKLEEIKDLGDLATPEKTKVVAYTLGAITPCIRLSAFLSEELEAASDHDGENHQFQEWIAKSSKASKATALVFEDLLDELSAFLTGDELDTIEKLYQHALKLETEFFVTRPLAQPVVAPLSIQLIPAECCLVLFSNFDSTCSVLDSSAILVELAVAADLWTRQNFSENPTPTLKFADLRNEWTAVSLEYEVAYERCIESIVMTEKAERFDYEVLAEALETLSDLKSEANDRVIKFGIFNGIKLNDIKKEGEKLKFQDGCTWFFQKILQNKILSSSLHVLSYCLCDNLIENAFSSVGLAAVNVHANTFEYNSYQSIVEIVSSQSTGIIVKRVQSPGNKLNIYSTIIEHYRSSNIKNFTVYIGYSVGDLLCLLKADIGIVFGSNPSLRRVGTHFGISFVPLFQGLVKLQKEYVEENPSNLKSPADVLYTVSSWDEIHAFILEARN